MRSKWTLIPLAIIIVLAAGLTGRNAIYTWIDWNYRTENPHAELVPDSADLMVTIDLARLRDPQVIDALNGWRQRVSGTERAEDVTTTASRWTGHDFSDDAIARWAGRRLTLMSGPWGNAIAIDAREKLEALAWLERNEDGWAGGLDDDVVWLAETEATERIAETKRYGLRTTIATTADCRRARRARPEGRASRDIRALATGARTLAREIDHGDGLRAGRMDRDARESRQQRADDGVDLPGAAAELARKNAG